MKNVAIIAFAAVLFAVTFGLTWRAQTSQQRWTRLIDVELRAVATLDELIRTQSSFTLRGYADARAPLKYRNVEQLLDRPVLEGIDVAELRSRVGGFRRRLEARPPDARLLAVAGRGVVTEAQRLADGRKQEVARQIPRLQRETRDTRKIGLATAWIVLIAGPRAPGSPGPFERKSPSGFRATIASAVVSEGTTVTRQPTWTQHQEWSSVSPPLDKRRFVTWPPGLPPGTREARSCVGTSMTNSRPEPLSPSSTTYTRRPSRLGSANAAYPSEGPGSTPLANAVSAPLVASRMEMSEPSGPSTVTATWPPTEPRSASSIERP